MESKAADGVRSGVPTAPARDELQVTIDGIAHEINNSLSVLRLTADLLRQQAIDPVEAGTAVRDEAVKAAGLVKRLRSTLR